MVNASKPETHRDRQKRVATLKAVVDDLQGKEAELQERLKAAYADYYAAEREMKHKEPLTRAMKAALKLAVESGGAFMKSQLHGHSYWVDTPADSDTDSLPIRPSVFYGLMSRGVLSACKYDGALRYRYEVTEHGKSLMNGQGTK